MQGGSERGKPVGIRLDALHLRGAKPQTIKHKKSGYKEPLILFIAIKKKN